jgi:coenzyme F420-reducing hydrogenase delta subunit
MQLYSEDEMISDIYDAVRQARKSGRPAVVGFACRYCAYAGEEPDVVKAKLPQNVRAIDVLCSGKVDALYLLKAFEFGADAVFVAGCMESECHNEKGSIHAGQRVVYIKQLLDQIGLGGARLEMFNLAPGQCADLTAAVATLSATVQDLGPNPVKEC